MLRGGKSNKEPGQGGGRRIGFGLWKVRWCTRDGSGTRGEARAASVVSRGCRRTFPSVSAPRCSGSLLGSVTAPFSRAACLQLGSEGLGGCPGRKSPLKAGSWVVAGDDALLGGSSRRVFYSPRAAEGCPPPKVSPADGSAGECRASLAAVTASALPGEETEYIQHPAAAAGLEGQRLDRRVTLRPCSNSASPCKRCRAHQLSRAGASRRWAPAA